MRYCYYYSLYTVGVGEWGERMIGNIQAGGFGVSSEYLWEDGVLGGGKKTFHASIPES